MEVQTAGETLDTYAGWFGVKVKKSTMPNAGYGLFATRPFNLCEVVCFYQGVPPAGAVSKGSDYYFHVDALPPITDAPIDLDADGRRISLGMVANTVADKRGYSDHDACNAIILPFVPGVVTPSEYERMQDLLRQHPLITAQWNPDAPLPLLAIQTLAPIAAGEEVFVQYGPEHCVFSHADPPAPKKRRSVKPPQRRTTEG
jgi:hypothetical protein